MRSLEPAKSVKKFYFLEYFYVLLKSIERYSDEDNVFDSFKFLKQKYLLGESRYKKLIDETENLSRIQMSHYRYTFEQVLDETLEYKFVTKDAERKLYLTDEGRSIVKIYEENGLYAFNKAIFSFMEQNYLASRYLIKLCYADNPENGGLLIFPIYSPRKLGLERSDLKTAGDIIRYSLQLQRELQKDIQKYLYKDYDLSEYQNQLVNKLQKIDHLIPAKEDECFDPKKYNAIMKRFRDFWLNVFFKEIYHSKYSFTSFDLWAYRAKQIGIIHVTEFYPNFNGRIVYPTAVILNSATMSEDFEKLFEYEDGSSLYIHHPSWNNERTQEQFVKVLIDSYFDMRKTHRNYFINLADVRELVCYNLKISENLFDEFLEKTYKLNIAGQLPVRISLEADKLPQETGAMYLKRYPVMVDNKYRNIIAIDITKGERTYDRHAEIINKT